MSLARLKTFAQRLHAGFFSENTYNTVAFYVFYFGYITQMYPIEPPVRRKFGNLGEVVVLRYRRNTYQHFVRGFTVCVISLNLVFGIVQIIRFFPSEGFTTRVVFIVFYVVCGVLCFLATYCNFQHERLLPHLWNCIETTTKLCRNYGAEEAEKWKYSPISLLVMLSGTFCCVSIALGLVIIHAVEPNLPTHFFYGIPEPWKQSKIAYIGLLLLQTFLILASNAGIVYMLFMAVGFVIGAKTCAAEVAATPQISTANRIRAFRALEMLNQMTNEYAKDVLLPLVSFVTISVGVTFTYITLTRYGDEQLGLLIYSMVVIVDVILLVVVTVIYVQAGKYSDASVELIESIRMSMKKEEMLKRPDLPYWRKRLAALAPFGLSVGSYAKIDVETVKFLHETIIDNLMLLLSY